MWCPLVAFDYCVVGNGLLGASAGEFLAAKGAAVCIIGAPYGTARQYYSSHEDSSRIFRTSHDSAYWQELARTNFTALRALEATTGIEIFDAAPVYFDRSAAALLPVGQPTQYLVAQGLLYQDALGGVINPKRYIEALNLAAQGNDAVIHCGVVERIVFEKEALQIDWNGGRIVSRNVIDLRGIHTAAHAALKVQAKVLFFVTHAGSGHKHCLVKCHTTAKAFADVYGCVQLAQVDDWALSKFGFSEAAPLYLESAGMLRAWFQRDYLDYPHRAEAVALIHDLVGDEIQSIAIQPCAFTVTGDGKPLVAQRDRYLSVSGCNGMAAKCCQALMASVLEECGV